MRDRENDIRKVEEAFAATHRRRNAPEACAAFDADVMRHIRRIDAALSMDRFGSLASDPAVWRFAASTCLVALLLITYAFLSGLGAEHEMSMAFLDNATDAIVVQSLGVL